MLRIERTVQEKRFGSSLARRSEPNLVNGKHDVFTRHHAIFVHDIR